MFFAIFDVYFGIFGLAIGRDSAIRPGGGPPVRLAEAAATARPLSSDSERGT